MKYRIWIEQVNQDYFDVSARTEGNAIDKAKAEWRRENRDPQVTAVAELNRNSEQVRNRKEVKK